MSTAADTTIDLAHYPVDEPIVKEQASIFSPAVPAISRQEFIATVEQTLNAHQSSDLPIAIVIMDINGFRDINFRYGHSVGDALLSEISSYLKDCLRAEDPVWRIGDDEYGTILTEMHNANHAELAAEKIMRGLQKPLTVGEEVVDARLSVGISMFPDSGLDTETVIRQATVAMRAAKLKHKGYSVYSEDSGAMEELPPGYTAKLRRAITENRLEMYYQAKVDLSNDTVAAAEALVRWNDPELGPRSPEEFIPVAERSDLVNLLTIWTINASLAQCAQWHQQGYPISVAVNLSAKSLTDPDMPALTQRALETWNIDPAHLTLELTETAMMEEQALILPVLERLSEHGIKLSIDDFGTGYSSLAYLRSLPVDELKIDKSFVLNIDSQKDDATIVKTIVELSKNFNLSVTAEGIENEASYSMLRDLRCDLGQGFHISKPLRAEEFLHYLQDHFKDKKNPDV